MRLRSMLMPVALGLVVYAILRQRHKQRARRPLADDLAPDPGDPVQGLYDASELMVDPLDLDARSQQDVEAAQDLAGLASDLDERTGTDEVIVLDHPIRRDDGDLYGAHTPPAVDRIHPDDDRAFDDGQNWVEALETSAVENGAEPERSLDDIIDDEDVLAAPHASSTRDRPVADYGSGGRRGL